MGRFVSAFPGRFPSVVSPGEDDSALAAWLAERCGYLTASRMKDAIAFKKNGEPMQVRSDLMRDIVAERLTDISTRHYVTPAMQWGLDHEQEAKDCYSLATGHPIVSSGFYKHPTIEFLGGTPDGELDNDGLIETKCPTTGTFIEWSLAGVVPPEHVPQMLTQLAVTQRKWVEFVAFDPRIKQEDRQLFIRRYTPKPEDITSIELQAQRFLNEVEELWSAFHDAQR